MVVLTGADPYYCAGVNLAATIQPMHPRKLHNMIRTSNQAVFDSFLDFPKPIIVAANGPAIGACVTSASTCDTIIASERATFLVPFARLAIPPEGCSSVHFHRMLGPEAARRMLEEVRRETMTANGVELLFTCISIIQVNIATISVLNLLTPDTYRVGSRMLQRRWRRGW